MAQPETDAAHEAEAFAGWRDFSQALRDRFASLTGLKQMAV